MKVTVIPKITGALGTISRSLVKELEELEIRGQVETIQTRALLRSSRILRRVLGIKSGGITYFSFQIVFLMTDWLRD